MEEKKKTTDQIEDTKKITADTEDAQIEKDQLDQVSGAGRPPQHTPPQMKE